MRRDEALVLVNLQSEVAAPFLAAVAEALGACAGLAVRFDDAGDWVSRRGRLLDGTAQLGFWCGLPYAREAERAAPRVGLLAAPVMASARYGDRPVYFSDVVVREGASARSIAELAGRTWAYNEPDSHSGYWLPRRELARSGLSWPHFGRVVEAGSHTRALALLRAGAVDAAAIDSTVLDWLAAHDAQRLTGARIIARWGPSPMPPLVASTHVAPEAREALRDALLAMHEHPVGRQALALGLCSRFAAVSDGDYEVLRKMAAEGGGWPMAATGVW